MNCTENDKNGKLHPYTQDSLSPDRIEAAVEQLKYWQHNTEIAIEARELAGYEADDHPVRLAIYDTALAALEVAGKLLKRIDELNTLVEEGWNTGTEIQTLWELEFLLEGKENDN